MAVSSFRRTFAALAMGLFSSLGIASGLHANTVQTALEGEQLKIFGDNASNAITVSQNSRGDVIIRGRNGTTVNGRTSVRYNFAVLNSVEILMEGGNDDVVVNGLSIDNDLFANLGAGNDTFRSGSTPVQIGNNLAVEGGDGRDTIRLTGWFVASDLYIDGQVGTLIVTLAEVTSGFATTVIGDDSRDIIRLSDCNAGDFVSLETKKGNDLVVVDGQVGLGLAASVDEGDDDVILRNLLTSEDVMVTTGKGADLVEMRNVTSGKNIGVSLDEGADIMDGVNVFAQFDAVFEGGSGVDVYIDGGIAGGEKTEVKEFEVLQ